MLRAENIESYGWVAAVRGMRSPMNSWAMSDSKVCGVDFKDCTGDVPMCPRDKAEERFTKNVFCVGEKDFDLMRRLINAGNDHAKFMRMIGIAMDITAPLYWWKEFDTYKVGTVADSCSTMHRIAAKEFEMSDFSVEHVLNYIGAYNPIYAMEYTINILNFWRKMYNMADGMREDYFRKCHMDIQPSKKECWWQLIQLLPSSYNQRRTVTLNYAVARAMYQARKNHKLDEWHTLCEVFEKLPYSDLITMERT